VQALLQFGSKDAVSLWCSICINDTGRIGWKEIEIFWSAITVLYLVTALCRLYDFFNIIKNTLGKVVCNITK
jgi:hypothetical protein